jgi:hypothetical protein
MAARSRTLLGLFSRLQYLFLRTDRRLPRSDSLDCFLALVELAKKRAPDLHVLQS